MVVKMTKHLKTVKASLIMGILLLSAVSLFTSPTVADRAISFKSYVDFEYDTSALNEPLAISVSVSIPITVKYWTNIPDIFMKIPYPFNNYILFGSRIAPMQTIHLEVLNIPDWANIYISAPDILTDIPFEGDGLVEIETNLILSSRIGAPAESYRIDIKATWDSIKRLDGNSYQESIEFTPAYLPIFTISVSDPSINVTPNEKTTVPIGVKNQANKASVITPFIKNNLSDFSFEFNPSEMQLDKDETGTFNLEIVSSSDFKGKQRIEIEFAIEQYPLRSNSASMTSSVFIDLYYEPEITEEDEFNLYLIFGVVLLIAVILSFILGRYRFSKK